MRSPSALSASIMLSLFIILAGALLIIFIQFDRGYQLPTYTLEQNHITPQANQRQRPLSETARQTAPIVITEPSQQTMNPAPRAAAGHDTRQNKTVAQTNVYPRQRQDYVPYNVLLDSPWSPYYQPPRLQATR